MVVQPALYLLTVAFGLYASGVVVAQTAKETTVCYKHVATEAVLFNCKQVQGPNDAFPRAYCYDRRKGKSTIFKPGKAWKPLPGDHTDCQPLPPVRRVPRGGEEESS